MTEAKHSTFQDVLHFWFVDTAPAQWWRADPTFDALVTQRFGTLHVAAHAGELAAWRSDAHGRLAEVLVLDQFSRTIHRNTAAAFACDPMALALAQEAVAGQHDVPLNPAERAFLYMPYMHSESRLVQQEAARLFAALGRAENQSAAQRHKAIIDRFGRYPHRNTVLGRASTSEELAFLREPGSSF